MAMDVPPGLTKGSSFSSYKELEPLLQELDNLQLVPFTFYCSRPVKSYNAKFSKNLPEQLVYQSLTYACVHYGKKRSNSRGERPNQSSFKMGCKARLRIRVDESCMRLTISEMDLLHVHTRKPEDAAHYPQNRKLTGEEGTHVKALMDLEVRPVVLQSIIRTSTAKLTTLQDLRNLQQRMNKGISKITLQADSEVEKLLKELEDTQADDPNCTLVIGRQENDVVFIFWASSRMKTDFEAFPEVISVDSTYNVNNAEMPLTLFLCQNQHGNGRLAGVCLMKDEKKDTLRESISCFAECYSSSIHKVSTFFVDKSMNEVSRIWEILPNVDIHLCRFHCDQIFKKETQKEAEKISVRSNCKAMLYTETHEEYEHHFCELNKVCSETFKKYFLKNWHSSRTVWKGHERLQGVTFGLTTTNPNESLHGKLKKLLNRKRTITQCFNKLRLFHTHFNVQAAHKDFESRCKVKYVTNSSDSAIQEITTSCYPFAAELIRFQLRCSYEMKALPASYSIDCEKCLCAFYRSRKFPCCHMFFSRLKNESTLFSVDDVPLKWRINGNRQITRHQAEAENVDDDFEEQPPLYPPPVLVPSAPVKVGGKALTKAQKYTGFLKLCEALGSVASLCGGAQYVLKCNVIESILDHWENNIEVCVTPLSSSSSEPGNAKQDNLIPERPSVIVHRETSDSSVTTAHVNDNESEQLHSGAIIITANDTEAHTPNTSPEKAPRHTQQPATVGQDQQSGESCPLVCRCGLPAVEYRPLFGFNSGKLCFRCPKKLPDIPCTFSTVKTTENVTSCAEIFVGNTNPNKSKGIVKTPFCALNEKDRGSLKLPTAKKVVGQPKMGVQRSFKKTNKPWTIPNGDFITDRDKRRTKGSDIPDSDVSFVGSQSWTVKSQKSKTTYQIEKTVGAANTCFCENTSSCVHCFSCQCPDYRIRATVCKHIYKVQQVYMQSLSETADNHLADNAEVNSGDDADADDAHCSDDVTASDASKKEVPEKSHEEEQDDSLLSDLADALEEECAKITAETNLNGDRTCQICINQGKPTPQSAHKCANCSKPIHLFGCSTKNPNPNGEEGYGGSDRICWCCHDAFEEKHANNSNNNKSSSSSHVISETQKISLNQGEDEGFICFGCNVQRVRRVSTKPLSLGRVFYVCLNPLKASCKAFLWARTKAAPTKADPINKNSGTPQSSVIQKYFSSESKCTVCSTNCDSKVKCCNCRKQVHLDTCSFSSGTLEDRLCKNCFCLLCRTVNVEGHKCLCSVCQRTVNASIDMLCYRCERLVHDRCSEQIRAPEIQNQLRYICKHCFAAMATGVSNSIRGDIMGNKMLSDEHMARASVILSAQFGTTIDGLCAPLAVTYGDKVDNSNYYPTKTEGSDYVQIINTGRKHWVTAIFKKGSQDVIVLDSLRSLALSGHTKIQIAMVSREEKSTITVIRPPCKQQLNARDCGVFAIAFAVDFCYSNTSDFVDYNPSAMRDHLLKCLEAGSFSLFPRLNQTRVKRMKDHSTFETFEILCTCRLPRFFDVGMVMCETCCKWFHNSCAGLDVANMPDTWYCLECTPVPELSM